jgi:choline dehydrogenase-like flavoprotein
MQSPDSAAPFRLDCDVLVIGGGTARTMAALSAAERGAQVLLLEKAHVRHSGALAMGMDGVNNAVIQGKAEPEDYVAEITRANDGIVNQRTVYQAACRGFAMVQRLERYGVKFEKDEHGEYAVRRVHRSGSYVLPMPEGKDVKKGAVPGTAATVDEHHVVAGPDEPIREGRPGDAHAADQDGRLGHAAQPMRSPQYLGVQQAVLRVGPQGGVDGMADQPALQLEPGSLQHSN